MFATRYLHFIDQQGLSVWVRQGGRLHCLARFAEDDPAFGIEAYATWISQRRNGIHRFLLNLPDEGFHVEQIPPVSGQDRKTLIARRQMQQFFGTPYSTAISLGRSSEGRRDERVLLLALTRPAALEPWLQCLRDSEARLAGVSSASLLTRQILACLQPDSPRGLILSLSSSGIRQTYFEHGALRFSRLSPAPEGALRDWGETCLHEAQKTAQYLTAQRWITRNINLPVWLLVRREDFPTLAERMDAATQFNTQLDFRLASIDAIARQAGMRAEFKDSDCTPLLMHLALREKGTAQFAPNPDRRFFHLWRIRNAIAALGILASAVLSLLAFSSYRETQSLAQQDLSLRADMENDQRRYQQLLASLPAMPTSLETLQGVVDGHARLLMGQPQPDVTLKQIAHALDQFPDISLQSLTWQPEKAETTADKQYLPQSTRQIYILDASLPENQIDARTAIARIQAFAEALKHQTKAEIAGLKMPFDSEPEKTLRSDSIVQKGRPSFQVRLRMPEATP